MHVAGILCSLAKAFDCVKHEVFILKLRFYGIWDAAGWWFKS
jgi:hypothetical protein